MVAETGAQQRLPIAAITIAALTAVAFWSLKPIFISIIGDRGDYAEVYVVSAAISVAVSAVCALVLRRRTMQVFRGGRASRGAALNAAASGLFLALWYYGFYRALYGAAKTDATIIAFTWPLIAVIVMPLLSPSTAPKLKKHQWLMVLASFVGAAAIGVANTGAADVGSSGSGEIVWAFVAAIGSGLYLPFAINATKGFDASVRSKPLATFYAIATANLVALVAVLIALRIADHPLRFYAFDAGVLGVCALIGIGTYLVAEITWTWAFQEYKSLTLSSLPYFSPAVSVVLLHVFFDEPVRPIAAVGLVLILFSNLTLHARHRSTNALSLTLVASVYVALASQVLPTEIDVASPELAAAMTGLFAILAGFILSRAADRRTQELDARATLVRRMIGVDEGAERDRADALLRHLIEMEFDRTQEGKERHAEAIRRDLTNRRTSTTDEREALEAFDSWQAIHLDRLSIGERAALWITGLGSIVFVMLVRGESFLGNAGAIAFACGALLAIFTILDYDRNNIHGFRNQMWRLQQGFREIGKPYYVPQELLEGGEISETHLKGGLRTANERGEVRAVRNLKGSRTFNTMYLGTAALVVLGVILAPAVTSGASGTTGTSTPHPGELQGGSVLDGTAADAVRIADPGWPAGSVLAHIVAHTIASAGASVVVEEMSHTDAVLGMTQDAPTVEVHPDFWLQNQAPRVAQLVETGTLRVNDAPYHGTQGIYVLDSDRTVELLANWDDLDDPDVARLFDSDGDGLGEIWVGQRGWVSTENLQAWFEGGGAEWLEAEVYSETIFNARVTQAHSAGGPLLFYGYQPDWLAEEIPIRLLTPLSTETVGVCLSADTTCGQDPVSIYVAWSADLDERLPELSAVLAAIHIDVEDVNGFIADVVRDGADPEEVAQLWVEQHEDLVASWSGASG